MKIISLRRGFHADHSSTSYEFLAVDKHLDKSARKKVARLSSRARPTKTRVSFVYNGEWSDLPGGWEPLLANHYDVMYTESYDWWTLAFSIEVNNDVLEKLKQYDFRGEEDLGVDIERKGDRALIAIHCRLSNDVHSCPTNQLDFYDDDEDSDENDDFLLDLLAKNRQLIRNGDYRLLYGVWQAYSFDPSDPDLEEEEDAPPEPPGMDNLPEPIQKLLSYLEQV